jgi:hypothetical protein
MGQVDTEQNVTTGGIIMNTAISPNINSLKRRVLYWLILILVLTMLEFPAPIGFETRPQTNVSRLWLLLFFAIVVSEIASMRLIFSKPAVGAALAILAGVLNLLQIIADQTHMMQPETAPFKYSMLEFAVGLISIVMAYSAWNILKSKN